MLAVLHSDINSLKSGLLHLTGLIAKSRTAKFKDELEINVLGTISLIETGSS
jgi:hypothetical protein